MPDREEPGVHFRRLIHVSAQVFLVLLVATWSQLPAGLRHLAMICAGEPGEAIYHASGLVGLLAPTLFLVVVTRGVFSGYQQLGETRQHLRRLYEHHIQAPEQLLPLINQFALAGRIVVIDDPRLFAFTAGVRRPNIWLSTGLLDRLDDEELAAVLRHELHHLRQQDARRVLIARALADALFFLPVVSELRDGYLLEKELTADAEASQTPEEELGLARALLKLLSLPAWVYETDWQRLAIGSLGINEARIARLAYHTSLLPTPQRRTTWISSGITVAFLIVLFLPTFTPRSVHRHRTCPIMALLAGNRAGSHPFQTAGFPWSRATRR